MLLCFQVDHSVRVAWVYSNSVPLLHWGEGGEGGERGEGEEGGEGEEREKEKCGLESRCSWILHFQ